MIVSPRVRGFICTTAHPTGCARLVEDASAWVRPIFGFEVPEVDYGADVSPMG